MQVSYKHFWAPKQCIPFPNPTLHTNHHCFSLLHLPFFQTPKPNQTNTQTNTKELKKTLHQQLNQDTVFLVDKFLTQLIVAYNIYIYYIWYLSQNVDYMFCELEHGTLAFVFRGKEGEGEKRKEKKRKFLGEITHNTTSPPKC